MVPNTAMPSKVTEASSDRACKSTHSGYENMLFERVVKMTQNEEIVD